MSERLGGSTTTGGSWHRWLALVAPLVVLLAVVGGFLLAAPLADVSGGAPLPDLTVTHATLPNDETVVLHVTNNGPQSVTISQVLVDDAYWAFDVRGADDATLAPLESAQIVIPYHWTPTWDLHTTMVLSDGATFGHTIVAPQPTPGLSAGLLWQLALVGLFVGVLPVGVGMLWYPYLRRAGDRVLHAALAFSVGILAFLGVDAGVEALALAGDVPGAFEGPLLVALGIGGTALLVQAVGGVGGGSGGEADAADVDPDAGGTRADGGGPSPLRLAGLVALGIGLHNLAEGLAIGSALAVGHTALGAFLVVGFMLHNVTEGPAVVAPLARGEGPGIPAFVGLGLLAGAPVVLGGWIGSLAYSPTLAALFLAIGVGAIVQVVWAIGGMIARDGRLGSPTNLLALGVGLVVMYLTDLLVAL